MGGIFIAMILTYSYIKTHYSNHNFAQFSKFLQNISTFCSKLHTTGLALTGLFLPFISPFLVNNNTCMRLYDAYLHAYVHTYLF